MPTCRTLRQVVAATLWTGSALIMLAGCAATPGPSDESSKADRPNFLLIVVDDMGFNDLGSFGSEIDTPNLDALALAGTRLLNFQVASTCSPTRSMLLTGVDSHRAGLGNMLEELSPNQKGKPGYEGYLNDRVVTLPRLLRDAGYFTAMAGKWHLGQADASSPTARGFETAFSLVSGGASHFDDMRPAYAPSPEIKAKYRRDGKVLDRLPDQFDYSSQYYVDYLIEALGSPKVDGRPFFAYLSFTAPHWPLQAPDDAIRKYRGRYDRGYDVLMRERLERAKAHGVVPANAALAPAPPNHTPWTQLSDEQRRVQARAMEIYAAMIDEIDRHTGRLLQHLRERGDLENTIVLFMSDNGAEGHDLDETWPADAYPKIRRTIDESHDFSYDAMGRPGSYVLYGPSWAWAGAPAFRMYKAFPTEGGTRAAAFVHAPNRFSGQRLVGELVSVKDVTPTFLDLAGVDHPGSQYGSRRLEPMTGVSQRPLLEHGQSTGASRRVLGFELFGKRSVRQGDWKIVHMPAPYGRDNWELFDLASDPGEADDLSAEHPARRAELIRLWERYAERNGVILPDWVSGY